LRAHCPHEIYFPRELENPLRLELERLLPDENREKKPELLDDDGRELVEGREVEVRLLEKDLDVEEGRVVLELL
jgi:hypothetical protein